MQDYNIKNYSVAALEDMLAKICEGSTACYPFDADEIGEELERRNGTAFDEDESNDTENLLYSREEGYEDFGREDDMRDEDFDEPDMSYNERCWQDRNDYANEMERKGMCPIQAAEIRMGA